MLVLNFQVLVKLLVVNIHLFVVNLLFVGKLRFYWDIWCNIGEKMCNLSIMGHQSNNNLIVSCILV